MKTLKSPIVGLLALACGPLVNAATPGDDYTNFIYQWQQSTDPTITNPIFSQSGLIKPADEGFSPSEVGAGSRFLLVTFGPDGKKYDLAETFVAGFAPASKIQVSSGDPYTPPRTRADKPIKVEVTVQGLELSTSPAAIAAKEVDYRRYAQSYGENTNSTSTPNNVPVSTQGIDSRTFNNMSGGVFVVTYPFSAVPGTPFKRRGEERHEIWSKEYTRGDGKVIAPHKLAAATIQVWPRPTGTIGGIDPNAKYRFEMPELTLTYDDIYPNSTVEARVYRENASPREYFVIPGSSVTNTQTYPIDQTLKLSNYGDVFNEDGQWIMEIVAVTPFEAAVKPVVPLILDTAPVGKQIDRAIKVNSTLSTLE